MFQIDEQHTYLIGKYGPCIKKEENVDKPKHSRLTSSEKSSSANNEEKGNKPQFEKRKKVKVKMNEDTDEDY